MAQEKTLVQLVEELEGVLHEELPAAARARVYGCTEGEPDADEAHKTLAFTLDRLQGLQRDIGMATFELIRNGGGDDLRSLQRRQPYTTGDAELGTDEQPQAPPAPRARPPIEEPSRCIGCARVAVGTCGECKKPCCEQHLHSSQHPCGEMP